MPQNTSTHSSPFRGRIIIFWAVGLAALVIIGINLTSLIEQQNSPTQHNIKPSELRVFTGASGHPDHESIPISRQCGACHPEIFRAWAKSDHAWAHRDLNSKWDAEPFHAAPLSAHGSTLTFSTTANGQRQFFDSRADKTYTATMASGRTPLVQYLVPSSDGGYHTTSAAWDVLKREWFDMFGSDSRNPEEWGHWTGKGMIWNTQCAWCHVSDFQKNYDTKTHRYASTWKEPGITCIQCHGPLLNKPEETTGCMINTHTSLSLKQQADNCASCHARRDELDNNFRIGSKFEDHFTLSLPTQPGLFWPNGMQRDEVYTETGLKLSRMGKAGIQCLDCHNPHTGTLKKPVEDNSLCLQCHGTGERKAPIIDPLAHSHHKEGSLGNRCVECHMPESTYMARDPRRDHAFASPDPLLSQELGSPNACIMCHKNNPHDWAAKYVKEWYGDLPKTAHRSRSRAVHVALQGAPTAFKELIDSLEKEENTYWRATLLELLEDHSTEPRVHQQALLSAKSTNPRERVSAARVLGQTRHLALVPLLKDEAKIVRIQAAWALRSMLEKKNNAMQELEASSLHQADQPGGAMKLAQIYAARALMPQEAKNTISWNTQAETWFKKALEWDPTSPIVPRDYAIFLATQNRQKEALTLLKKAQLLEPKNPQIYILIGLGEAEIGHIDEAIASFTQAIALDPNFLRAYYNRALLYNQQGKLTEALADLDKASQLAPQSPNYLYTKAVLLYKAGKNTEARATASLLLKQFPQHTETRQLLSEL